METLPEKFNDFVSPLGGHVRVVMKDGDPWFVAKDVAETLGYVNAPKAIAEHCRKAVIFKDPNLGCLNDFNNLPTSPRGFSIIPESDVYRLAMRSNLPSAEAFQDWICEDVIPTIRKTGAYALPRTMQDALRCLADSLDREAAGRELIAKQALAIETAKDALCCTEAQRDKAIREKAWINSSRSGKCMRKVRTANETVRKVEAEKEELKIKLSEAADWKTVTAMNKELSNFFYKLDRIGRQRIGKKVKSFSEVLGLPIKRAVDIRFGEVNAYHFKAWNAFFQFLLSPESASFMAAWRRD